MVQAHHIHDETPYPSALWHALSHEERFTRIQEALLQIEQILIMEPTFRLVTIQNNEIIVCPVVGLQSGMLGEKLREFEILLREILGEPLELYCEHQKDQNKPRNPDQRQKIIAWLNNRKRMKEAAEHAQ